MHIDILTLFPEMMTGVLNYSILHRAQEKRLFTYDLINFRDYTTNKHHKVDDYPYGGGAGMVLTPQPIFDAVDTLTADKASSPRIVLMCPQGEENSQKKAEELALEKHLIFICGLYECLYERIRNGLVTDEISIVNYVLTGGELGAMVVVDSVVRLLPDVLGNKNSAPQDSFSTGLLEHPHYTRPANFRGMKVPVVLLSGHHEKINKWRKKESLRRTYERRPELLKNYKISENEKLYLNEITNEKNNNHV